MLYILYGLFHGDQMLTRLACIIAGIISIWIFFYLAKILFKKTHTSMIASTIFAFLLGIPLLEGNIANAENFMMPLNLIAGFCIARLALDNKIQQAKIQRRVLLIAGLILGISFLFKVIAIFDLAAFSIFLFILEYRTIKHVLQQLKQLLPLWIGFFAPLVCTMIYFLSQHMLSTFIHAAFLSNIGYVNYGNQFIIPQGLLLFKLLVLGAFCIAVWIYRKKIAHEHMFIYLWFAFSLFGALFSQRPYTHYMLVMLTSFVLLTTAIWGKKRIDFISSFIYFLLFFFIWGNFNLYKKNIDYYRNFLSFSIGQQSLRAYQAFFDSATPRDYELAAYLISHMNPDDNIFIWGNNGQVYKLVNKLPPGRYIVAYHITTTQQTQDETKEAVAKTLPRYVIIMPGQSMIPLPLLQYREKIAIDKALIYERIN